MRDMYILVYELFAKCTLSKTGASRTLWACRQHVSENFCQISSKSNVKFSHEIVGVVVTTIGVIFRFLWPCIVSKVWRERKPTRCNNQMFIINFCLNMFRATLCPSSGEQWPCVTAYGVLRWFCWMWLVAVVGCCGASYNAAPHNCYQPHPAEPAQYTICSNKAFVLLKVGTMMPETRWDRSW
jgi:hypothetical protein